MRRPGVRRLFSLSIRRNRWESDVEEEILTHLSIRAERLAALGMSPQAARDEAIRRFGPLDESRRKMLEAAGHREEYMRRREAFIELRQDIAFAGRTLSRNKGWTAVAVLTLALGIGATTAVWSAASTLLVRPLSYPDAGRIVNVALLPTTGNATGVDVAVYPELPLTRAWRSAARSFEALEPYGSITTTLGLAGETEDVVVTRILPSFLSFAGEQPILGRAFTREEAAAEAPVALIGEGLWRTRFAGASSVLGQTLRVGNESLQIIGVMPATLKTPRIGARTTALWRPLDIAPDRGGFRVVGRLSPGVTPQAAARELDSIAVRAGVYEQGGPLPFRAVLTSPGESVSFGSSLTMLTGAVLLVLLVAAANVAHLLLARGLTRRREMAIRTALGASRGRLSRQMITETFVLSAAGCGLGALVGFAALAAVVKFGPPTLPELKAAHVDGFALTVVIVASMICALCFGAISAMVASMKQSAVVLRAGAVSAYSRFGERLRSCLVVTEMALSAMLLVGAALLIRTVTELQQTDLGFDPVNLHVVMPEADPRAAPPVTRLTSVRQLADAMRAIPGVEAVTVTDAMPSYRNFSIGTLEVESRPRPTDRTTSFIDVGSVTPTYFSTLGARLVLGRLPMAGAAQEIVINESFARKQWKNDSPVGHRIRVFYEGEDNPWLTIVGVVADISSMGPVGERGAPFLYTPLTDSSRAGIVYRTDGREASQAQAMAVARKMFPGVRLRQHSAQSIIANSLAPSRFIMILMAGFTVLTLILAAVGLYGMMAYAVAQRTREIGIRMALGATRNVIARSVVGRGALLGIGGAALGLMLAVWATRVIEGSLYGVTRFDGPSFVVGGIGLVVVAVAASLVPMRRAVAVDPMTAIRGE